MGYVFLARRSKQRHSQLLHASSRKAKKKNGRRKGARFARRDMLMKKFKSDTQHIQEDEREKLMPWVEHSNDCILTHFEAGEPTSDGGYRQKFAGKWYQSKPIDETPRCNCGLEEALST